MKTVVLYFQIHQPRRLENYSYFDIGTAAPYFNDELNRKIIQRISRECYLPVNKMFLDLIISHPEIKICFSISGSALAQFEAYAPDVIESFGALIKTGSVEILAETSHHTLASQMLGNEFEVQVAKHCETIARLWNVKPVVFRNTELIYSNEIADRVSAMGFKGVITDGVARILNERSPYQLYKHNHLPVILRSNNLSDDIGFRFERQDGNLSVGEYMSWLEMIPQDEDVIVLGLDYETFGEHRKKETGILDFLRGLVEMLWLHNDFEFSTASELIDHKAAHEEIDVPDPISWADEAKNLSAWLGNNIQTEAFERITKLGTDVLALNNEEITNTWRDLQNSDHFYYMSTKNFSDGAVHNYFSPYESPYEAFINYMNVLSDFELLVADKTEESISKTTAEASRELERERRELPEPVWVEGFKEEYNLPHLN
jgi:alpha-amylase